MLPDLAAQRHYEARLRQDETRDGAKMKWRKGHDGQKRTGEATSKDSRH